MWERVKWNLLTEVKPSNEGLFSLVQIFELILDNYLLIRVENINNYGMKDKFLIIGYLCQSQCFLQIVCGRCVKMWLPVRQGFKPSFPTYNKSAAGDFKNIFTKMLKISINKSLIKKKRVENIVAKVKLLVLSNFFFCHSVFKSRLLQMRQNAKIGGKWVIVSSIPHEYRRLQMPFVKDDFGKGEIVKNSNVCFTNKILTVYIISNYTIFSLKYFQSTCNQL